MSKSVSAEILPDRLIEHRAVRAWSRLEPERVEPDSIEILKLKNKTAVYRLLGVRPDGSPVIAKRCRAATAFIERMIYEEFLSVLALPALHCYGFVEESDGQFCWLFIEDARGEEYSMTNAEHRTLAGQWLATIHAAAARASLKSRLPCRDPRDYLEQLRATRETLCRHLANPAMQPDDLVALRAIAAHCDALETHWSELEEVCSGAPQTLVHGDFAPKNARVQSTANGPALLVFDWEMAGWGVPATDLAQFTGNTISPDLATYCAAMDRFRSPRDVLDAQRLAECGKFFRLLDDIGWAGSELVFQSYPLLKKPMSFLKTYEPALAEALRRARWTH